MLDLTTSAGRMVAVILGAVARQEVEHTIERILSEKQQKRAAGEWPGGPVPYGYRTEPTGEVRKGREMKRLVIHEPEAAHIRTSYKLIIKGRPLYAVTKAMNKAGSRTPARHDRDGHPTGERPWTTQTLRLMLCRASNAGLIEHKGEVIGEGQWEAIVEVDHWRAVRRVLTDPAWTTTPGPKPQHLLSGVLRCGVCGSTSFAVVNKKVRTAYQCQSGWHVSRDEAGLDALVSAAIVGLLAKPSSASVLRPQVDITGLMATRTGLRARLDEIGAAVGQGLDVQQAIIASKPLRDERDQVDQRLSEALRGDQLAGIAGEPDAEEIWLGLSLDRQREIVKALVTVTLLPCTVRGRRPKTAPRVDPQSVRITWTDLVASTA